MHDLLGGLANAVHLLADGSGAGSGDTAVKAAVIGAGALIIATAITAFASTFQRTRPVPQPEPEPDPPLVAELRRRAVSAEGRASRAEVRIDQLEAFCWDNNINPHSGEMIIR